MIIKIIKFDDNKNYKIFIIYAAIHKIISTTRTKFITPPKKKKVNDEKMCTNVYFYFLI